MSSWLREQRPHSKSQRRRTSYGTQYTDCSNRPVGGAEHNSVAGEVPSEKELGGPRGQGTGSACGEERSDSGPDKRMKDLPIHSQHHWYSFKNCRTNCGWNEVR